MDKCTCTWKDLVKWIMPYVTSPNDEFNGAPEPMVEAFVRRTANDFAHKSGVLVEKHYADIDCGVIDYPIALSRSTELVSIKRVSVNEIPLDKSDYNVDDDMLFLNNVPACDIKEGLCVEYTYAPCTEGSCSVPEGFCTRYREAIIDGALHHLLSMPNMDWYSRGDAQMHQENYNIAVSSARTDIKKRKNNNKRSVYDIKTRFIQ